MVSLMKKYFWFTYHILVCHTPEYILALDRFSWTTKGVWGPGSKKKVLFFFSLLEVLLANFFLFVDAFLGL